MNLIKLYLVVALTLFGCDSSDDGADGGDTPTTPNPPQQSDSGSGEGRMDAGSSDPDASNEVDASSVEVDAGSVEVDAGTVEVDAGSVEADAGSVAECGTTHVVTTTDDFSDINRYMDFSPEDLTIAVGDCVTFELSMTHNAIEVSEDTYNSRGTQALDGGFQVGFGETSTIRFGEPGVHYYICVPHVNGDMVGTITVE